MSNHSIMPVNPIPILALIHLTKDILVGNYLRSCTHNRRNNSRITRPGSVLYVDAVQEQPNNPVFVNNVFILTANKTCQAIIVTFSPHFTTLLCIIISFLFCSPLLFPFTQIYAYVCWFYYIYTYIYIYIFCHRSLNEHTPTHCHQYLVIKVPR